MLVNANLTSGPKRLSMDIKDIKPFIPYQLPANLISITNYNKDKVSGVVYISEDCSVKCNGLPIYPLSILEIQCRFEFKSWVYTEYLGEVYIKIELLIDTEILVDNE